MTARAPALLRLTPQVAGLLLLAGVAWLIVIGQAADMDAMSGTMGLGFPSFVLFWTLMMAAMMLPSVAPVASMYSQSVRTNRIPRLAGFATGYLAVWAAVGLPAFGLAWLAEHLTDGREGLARGIAVGVFAVCGLYQLSPFKSACLKHCRSPLALLLHYASYQGRLRDFRVGAHHGLFCVGCCWPLMVLLVAIGVMNLPAMLLLAIAILAEKLWPRGEEIARAFGVVALGLAVLAVWVPGVAPGLEAGQDAPMSDQMSDM